MPFDATVLEAQLAIADGHLRSHHYREAEDDYRAVQHHIEDALRQEQQTTGVMFAIGGVLLGFLLGPCIAILLGGSSGFFLGRAVAQKVLEQSPYYALYLRAQEGVLYAEEARTR